VGCLVPTQPQLTCLAQVADWFCDRALILDSSAGQLQHAITLLEAAVHRGVQGGVPRLLNQVGVQGRVSYDCNFPRPHLVLPPPFSLLPQARGLRSLVTTSDLHQSTCMTRLEEFAGMTQEARLQLLLLGTPDSEDGHKIQEALDIAITTR